MLTDLFNISWIINLFNESWSNCINWENKNPWTDSEISQIDICRSRKSYIKDRIDSSSQSSESFQVGMCSHMTLSCGEPRIALRLTITLEMMFNEIFGPRCIPVNKWIQLWIMELEEVISIILLRNKNHFNTNGTILAFSTFIYARRWLKMKYQWKNHRIDFVLQDCIQERPVAGGICGSASPWGFAFFLPPPGILPVNSKL